MHGRAGEEERRRRGMLPVHGRGTADGVDDNDDGVRKVSPRSGPVIGEAVSESGFFLKDGRKIHIGDCALFQSGNAPPFIGIIRWFSSNKENYLKLSVNWLYRPSDLKLAKGVPLEAAPNEVFYSFHKDEISAASLLHPCKVAFLRKGVELPSGISSFVCRRVYDIANKCLWWLTDQDYINEHQEEVDQLLDKTQVEMHAAVQSGGRSPKQLNGPSAQQLKSGSDSVQNSGSSVPSHGKGRKREKAEQSFESIKRDRATKPEDGDSGNFRSDSIIKVEISKITDRGGLTDTEGVEKLLNLMQLDRGGERKIDLASRILLADVIASTDRFDCLVRFVQLKGVLVLDDWLQEVHKGRIGDGNSPRESDKSIEELVLALLRALDKLPVNLHALQTSNIGKSVNILRQYKNSEIQKKARLLVDTWKKRVDAEMSKSIDTKSSAPGHGQNVSWSGKLGATDNVHGVNRRPASSEIALKAPVSSTQTSISKSLTAKASHVDTGRPSIVSSGSSKLASPVAVVPKDLVSKPIGANGPSEMQLTAIKEDRSSGSSQSQNNSQSCSSDHAKNGGTSWREDAKSSTAGSVGSNKGSGSASRHRKSSNGFLGTGSAGTHKEASIAKSASLHTRTMAYDKVSPTGTQCDRLPDTPGADTVNSQRLIVRLPNPGRSPARCTTSVSLEEASTIGSRASSPISSEKHDHNERKVKVKADGGRVNHSADANADIFHGNYKRPAVAEDVNMSPGSQDEECRGPGSNGNSENAAKASSSVRDKENVSAEHRSGRVLESCVLQEVGGSLSVGDDLGMNLLASVATGDMPKSECLSPASPVRNTSTQDPSACSGGASLVTSDNTAGSDAIGHGERKGMEGEGPDNVANASIIEEAKLSAAQTLLAIPGDGKKSEPLKSLVSHEDPSSKPEEKNSGGITETQGHNISSSDVEKAGQEIDRVNHVLGKRKGLGGGNDNSKNDKQKLLSPSSDENKHQDSANGKAGESNLSALEMICSSFGENSNGVIGAAKMAEKKTLEESQASVALNKFSKMSEELSDSTPIEDHASPATGKSENNSKGKTSITAPNSVPESIETDLDQKEEVTGCLPIQLAVCDVPSTIPSKDMDGHGDCRTITDDNQGLASSAEAVSLPKDVGSNGPTKCVFDLNEGINTDEVNLGESTLGAQVGCSSNVCLPSFLSYTVSPVSSGSVPITVAAPAKGPFVPPENLLKIKGEPGWKGSAATSAFRPAEPRKVLEMPLNTLETLSDSSSLKQSRPQLEFDLNVPDERVFHDIASSISIADATSGSAIVESHDVQEKNGGLDLDLNRVDGDAECGPLSVSTSRKSEVTDLLGKPAPGGFLMPDASSRGFDLNNGPAFDEAGIESASRSQLLKSNVAPFLSPVACLRMSGNELGNLSWFSPGHSYSAVSVPPFIPDRSDHPYPISAASGTSRNLVSVTGAGPLNSDLYRGPVLSSSPAMAFSPYANFPFGPNFPLPSTSFSGVSAAYMDSSQGSGACFPPMPSQLTGPAAAASPAYMRPILISIPESTASGSGSDSRRWGRQSLDLNAGPIGPDVVEGRDERMSSAAARQQFVASSQPFVDDPARLFQLASAGLKRKEPEGGWDSDRYTYKQPSRP